MATTYTGPEITGTAKPQAPKQLPDDPRMLSFEKMTIDRTGRLKKLCEASERRRTQLAVTMIKRFRGDMYGMFDRWDGGTEWIDVPREGLKARNIIAPVVRSNDTNWLNAESTVQVDATSSDPETRGGARVAQAVSDYFMSRHWTDEYDEQCSQLSQLSFNYFPYIKCRTGEDSGVSVPITGMVEFDDTPGGFFVCPGCGAKGPTELVQQGENGEPSCPQCGQAVEMDESEGLEEGKEPEQVEAPTGEYEQREGVTPELGLASSFEIRIDETNGRAGNVKTAQWLNHHYGVYRYELEELYAWAKDKLPKGQKWSESLQWKHALETSSGTLSTSFGRRDYEQSGNLDDLLEVEAWYFDPVACGGWRSPDDYKHEGGCLEIEKGQTVKEAFLARGDESFKGLLVLLCGDVVLFIGNESKNEKFSSGCWFIDATSFWGKAQEDLLDFQEMINEMVTLFFEHAMHNAMPHTILDGMMFDHQNWQRRPGHVSYTRKGLARDKPIGNYYEQVLPGQLSSDTYPFYAGLLDGSRDTSGVQPSTVGAPDATNTTGIGKITEQKASVGLMIPSQKSKGRAKVQISQNFGKAVQKYWTKERIMEVLTENDRSWNEEDIDAFKEMDLDKDVLYSIAEGTETPLSRDEKEMKLVQLLASGVIGNPAIPVELQQLLIDYAGVDYQANDYEAQMRLADAQYSKIKLLCKEAVDLGVTYAMVPDQMTGQPSQQINVAAIEEILTTPGIQIAPRQANIDVIQKFFNDQIVALYTADQPDMFLITTLQQFSDALTAQKAQNMTDEAVVQGTIQSAGAQAAQAGQPTEQGPPQEDPQAARDAQSQEKEKDRGFQAEQKDRDRQHQMEMEQAKQANSQVAARNAKVPAAPVG